MGITIEDIEKALILIDAEEVDNTVLKVLKRYEIRDKEEAESFLKENKTDVIEDLHCCKSELEKKNKEKEKEKEQILNLLSNKGKGEEERDTKAKLRGRSNLPLTSIDDKEHTLSHSTSFTQDEREKAIQREMSEKRKEGEEKLREITEKRKNLVSEDIAEKKRLYMKKLKIDFDNPTITEEGFVCEKGTFLIITKKIPDFTKVSLKSMQRDKKGYLYTFTIEKTGEDFQGYIDFEEYPYFNTIPPLYEEIWVKKTELYLYIRDKESKIFGVKEDKSGFLLSNGKEGVKEKDLNKVRKSNSGFIDSKDYLNIVLCGNNQSKADYLENYKNQYFVTDSKSTKSYLEGKNYKIRLINGIEEEIERNDFNSGEKCSVCESDLLIIDDLKSRCYCPNCDSCMSYGIHRTRRLAQLGKWDWVLEERK